MSGSSNLAAQLFYSGDWQAARSYSRSTVTAEWGVRDEGSGLTPARCSVQLDNTSGDYAPDDPRSALFGLIGRNTPGRVRLAGVTTVAHGAVSKWAPDKGVSPNDAWTDIEITGPSQRINASKVIKSALARTIDAAIAAGTGPAGYWPMEGYSSQPDRVSSSAPGVNAATHRFYTTSITSAFDWAGEETLAGSRSLPVLESNRLAVAGIEASTLISPAPSIGGAFWSRTHIPRTDNAHSVRTNALATYRLDYGYTFRINMITYPPGSTAAAVPADGEVEIQADWIDGDLNIVDSVTVSGLEYLDQWRHVYVSFVTSASDVDVEIFLDGESVGTGTITTGTLADVTRVTMNATCQDTLGEESGRIVVGHPIFMADTVADMDALALVHYQAGLGYPGELAAARYLRLLAEHSLEGSVFGDPDVTHAMGPQRPDTLPNLFTEVARTDFGLIYDARAANELEFRTGGSLYNQTAALALTFGAPGDVHTPLRPVTDDLGIANDFTATSRTGGTGRAEQTTGPNNVSDPLDDPEGITRVPGSIDVNPASDNDLDDAAGWSLHVSTWPGARYKNVTVNLFKHPELLADVYALRPGDRITIDELEADQVELLVLGGVGEIGYHQHEVTFNCVPAGPYRVGVLDATGNRISAAASRLAADFDAGTDTSMSVESDDALWTTTGEPFHIRVGGVVLNVTTVTGTTSPQTFTVDQAPVNGIERLILAAGPDALIRVNVENPIYVGA